MTLINYTQAYGAPTMVLAPERSSFVQDLHAAPLLQETLLPASLPTLPDWQVAARYQPAQAVGGDFYDFLPLEDGRVSIFIGDVAGKGVPAALFMATTSELLRSAALKETAPRRVLEHVNNRLCLDISPNMFVTCFYAILDPTTGRLHYANAGHNLPYRCYNGCVSKLYARGMPLGLMPDMLYEEQETTLKYGENILFYSDGLVEAHDAQREMFGFPRLQALLEEHGQDAALLDTLLHRLMTFTGSGQKQEDDVTLVMLRRSGIHKNLTGYRNQGTRSISTAALGEAWPRWLRELGHY